MKNEVKIVTSWHGATVEPPAMEYGDLMLLFKVAPNAQIIWEDCRLGDGELLLAWRPKASYGGPDAEPLR